MVIASACVGAYSANSWPTLSGFTIGELREVQKINTETIKQLGRNAALLHDNSDLVMRYSHWTVGHPDPVSFCPECFSTPIANTADEVIDRINQSPSGATSDNLARDAEEILRGVSSIGASIYGQRRGLLFTLTTLRKMAHPIERQNETSDR